MPAKKSSKKLSAIAVEPVIKTPTPNGDESPKLKYIGNFHKTLTHDAFGEVNATAYEAFSTICTGGGDFEGVDEGPLVFAPQAPIKGTPPTHVAKLVSPQAGRSTELLGPNPDKVEMGPAPGVLSNSTAAEMTELFWMAHLRDIPFDRLADPANVSNVVADLNKAYARGLADSPSAVPGRIQLGRDLPFDASGNLRIDAKTLFRAGLKDEDKGPIVSQFFLHDINYGTQLIKQTQVPYRRNRDYLTDPKSWLLAQNTGYDMDGDPYSQDNDFAKDMTHFEGPLTPGGPLPRYRIRNMRDLARFVNRDALHQAYFNAALLLLNWGAPASPGNPYLNYNRQTAFATLGGPNLLALVSEVASRALKVVWRQKWLVHRRLRPEAYGGLMQIQGLGYTDAQNVTTKHPYGLPSWVFETEAAKCNKAHSGSYLLPLAFSAGSPAHPAYGAGHASVAGACVTILKAWFDEKASIKGIMDKAPQIDPGPSLGLWQPADHAPDADLPAYTGTDGPAMTVLGELNKLAVNVAMGRSMGGVHWRTDNTRSLRLGERVATIILKRQSVSYAEQPLRWSYTNFDNNEVIIENGTVKVQVDQPLTDFYAQF